MTSQSLSYDSDPAHRPTVVRLTGFKRRVRTFDRLQLVCFQMDLRGGWSSTCPVPNPHPRRNQVGPRKSKVIVGLIALAVLTLYCDIGPASRISSPTGLRFFHQALAQRVQALLIVRSE